MSEATHDSSTGLQGALQDNGPFYSEITSRVLGWASNNHPGRQQHPAEASAFFNKDRDAQIC